MTMKKRKTHYEYMFLIYPYWNVNLDDASPVTVISAFLIYPYWNVNLIILVELII